MEAIVAINVNPFWVFFHEILPQMSSNLYKSFTSGEYNKSIGTNYEWNEKPKNSYALF